MKKIDVRKPTQYVPLTHGQFKERFFERFYDPAFDAVKDELERVCEVAWNGYIEYRKSPRTRPAGRGFAEPGSSCRSNGSPRARRFVKPSAHARADLRARW